jgi:SAM-dependent methyltransferase
MDNEVFDPTIYWQWRYRAGGNSGAGSRGRLADFKAAIVNDLIAANRVRTMIDFGCGDGVQMAMLGAAQADLEYLGVDVSPEALAFCRSRAGGDPRRRFMDWADFIAEISLPVADLTISMDVIYHLTDDEIFHTYLDHLFGCARQLVLIYASNLEARPLDIHVRHRRFTDTVRHRYPEWRLAAILPNRFGFDPARPNETSFADFYIYAVDSTSLTVTVPAG